MGPILKPMNALEKNASLVLAQEERFADALALHVLDRPKLSVWMILIPIIFVYFFYRYQKFSDGRKAFSQNYLINRKRALNEALRVIEDGKEPDIDGLARKSDLPEKVHKRNADVLAILVDHFIGLLRSEGETFNTLVRSAYQNRTNYLLFINQLNQAEKILNAALEPHLAATTENIIEVIRLIEVHSEKLRRKSAEEIFP
jgi:hypothetical protein